MLAATFTLTNCAQEIENPNDVLSAGIPFEIEATSAETKTANSASVVSWVAGDALNVFHAEAGATEYVNDNNFTIAAEDLTSGRFTGTLTEALTADSYDWYAFYPYKSQISSPANTSAGYTPIGSNASAYQTQNGYDNMDHIAGGNYPLYGVALGVASNVKPSFEMKHAYTVAKIVVKNTTDNELTVNTVSFTAPEAIVGTYYINFAGETLVYTGSGENYVSNVANLTVSDGTALAKNAEATFYLAFKPFTAAAGSELKIAVNGYEKTLPLENSVTFTAGKIKTLNFSYDATEAPSGPEAITVKEFSEKSDGDTVYELTGTVSGIYQEYNSEYGNISFYIKDETGEVLIFRMSCAGVDNPESISVGDVITVRGKKTTYNSAAQMAQGGTCVSHQNACEQPLIECSENKVSITAEAGATIYYTKDGNDPTVDSDVYTSAFDITETIIVKAFAVIDGKVQSLVAEKSCVYVDPDEEVVEPETYQHIFKSKPSTGTVTLSNISWTLSATNLNNYNSTSYAGVQFGTSSKTGQITLTSTSFSYNGKSKIKEIRLWLNNGSGSITPRVTVGGVECAMEGTIVKNTSAGSDYTKASMVTFTPGSVNSGEVVIDLTCNKAGYFCAIEIDVQ